MKPAMNDGDVPAWVQGVWRRDALRLEDGSVNDTARVFWVQTPTLFADIRVPGDRPDLSGRASLADCDDDAHLQLARQKGFAGSLRVDGRICRWRRPIDFQPPRPTADEGAMFRQGRHMNETGLHANYLEDYTLVDDGGGRFLALECREHRRLLVTAGNYFLFARGRAVDLPVGGDLADLVAAAPRERKIALLDCELSLGHDLAGDDPWRIALSTLPFREGRPLFGANPWRFLREEGRAVETTDDGERNWTIRTCTLDRQMLSGLFPG